MKDNQYTQKSITAINAAQDLASEYGNQELSQAHLLAALTDSAEVIFNVYSRQSRENLLK